MSSVYLVCLRLSQFWNYCPALLYGLSATLGCCLALMEHPWPIAFVLMFLWLPPALSGEWPRAAAALCIGFAFFSYTAVSISAPKLPAQGAIGTATLSIDSMTLAESKYGPIWILKGRLLQFVTEQGDVIKNVAFRMKLPPMEASELPNPGWSYRVQAKVKIGFSQAYELSVKRDVDWHPTGNSWSLAAWRYMAKTSVKEYITQQITNTQSAQFLSGLTTGEFSDTQIRKALGRFGLQHILAISGFHFAILASLLSAVLCCLLPYRLSAAATLVLLTVYMLFLGYGASIIRAFIAASICQLGMLVERPPSALNSMGVAMLAIMAYDPTAALSPAFQLSFLATGAILLLYPAHLYLVELFWPKRSLEQLVSLSRLDQHGYILLSLFRQAVALSLAVHLVTMPVSLYYFGQFPLLSLIYNLVFPFLVSISLTLLVLGSALHLLLPSVANHLHQLNGWYTQRVLNLTLNAPDSWDLNLSTGAIPGSLVFALCGALFLGGILWQTRQVNRI